MKSRTEYLTVQQQQLSDFGKNAASYLLNQEKYDSKNLLRFEKSKTYCFLALKYKPENRNIFHTSSIL